MMMMPRPAPPSPAPGKTSILERGTDQLSSHAVQKARDPSEGGQLGDVAPNSQLTVLNHPQDVYFLLRRQVGHHHQMCSLSHTHTQSHTYGKRSFTLVNIV